MRTIREVEYKNVKCVRLESPNLSVTVAPSVGGKIVSLVYRPADHEFLWNDADQPLQLHSPDADYDSNFYGAIDELLPNDLPETICGIDLPDHGELWTCALDHQIEGEALTVSCKLPRSGLEYRRTMTLAEDAPRVDFQYRITNTLDRPLPLLWKLHSALRIEEGDRIVCPARKGQPVDLEYSRWSSDAPFDWPSVEGGRADTVPPKSDEIDFLYLYELTEGRIGLENQASGMRFEYRFDLDVLPVCWLFASYGGFNNGYTAILEPCTTMPVSVNEAQASGITAVLKPGESLSTELSIYAGPIR